MIRRFSNGKLLMMNNKAIIITVSNSKWMLLQERTLLTRQRTYNKCEAKFPTF